MKWYLQIALRQLFPAGGRFPFFTAISVVGVMLGVTALVVVLSVMNGFGNEIRRMIVDTQGHVHVTSGHIIRDHEALRERVLAVPGVEAAAPFATGAVMVQFLNRPTFPFIQGIDPELEGGVVRLDRFMRYGTLAELDDDSVLLSSGLATSLGAFRGDEIEVYSPLLLERLKQDEVFLPRRFRIAGIFESGWSQVDENTLVCSLRTMQDLYGLDAGVHGIKVRLAPGADQDELVSAIGDAVGDGYAVRSWLDSNRDFLFVLQLEKNVMFLLLLIIILVSAFAITSSLLITVVRKTREIGLFGALGARSWETAACFCLQGLFLGVVGTALGFGLGSTILHFRNDIIHAFTKATGTEAALARFYQFSNLPAETSPSDVAVVAALSILVSTLAGVIPAWRAARLKPSEALRSE
ncbi:lipoprotein-releasing ABC transporter permease subunit [Opitutales bacterium ASA1]|uniref:ABC transporter permease n=1 Tax=Congregicoccus parvus TaxID=3081749 RepID=UPI002B2A1195|nr:lipoprotein-releasing ABC transporter permease subunit [Opitutales bacterium ASA1]